VTGDVTQVDLPGGAQSGLKIVREILDGIEDVHFANLTSADVVRHRLVGNIVDAYERWDASQQHARPTSGAPVRTSRTRRQGS
jgi:phosphate starvation-inducible PhoH-like protein